jgi:hypothetical protein
MEMIISVADRLEIHELLNLHGHLMDDGAFDRLDELLTGDATYDVTAYGAGVLHGASEIEAIGRELGDANPLGHHVTNVVISAVSDRSAFVRSKGIGVMSDGKVGTVVYEDEG